MNDRINHLEEKIAYLERHVTEQDKAMLELAEDIAKLRRELKRLSERPAAAPTENPDDLSDERPPHY